MRRVASAFVPLVLAASAPSFAATANWGQEIFNNAFDDPSICPAVITLPDGTTRTRQIHSDIRYGYLPNGPVRHFVDISEWDNIWGFGDNTTLTPAPWPGVATTPMLSLVRGSYICAKARIGAQGQVSMLNASGNGGPNVYMSVTTVAGSFYPGDGPSAGCLAIQPFGEPAGYGIPSSDGKLVWSTLGAGNPTTYCKLLPDTDVFYNITFADPASTVECTPASVTCRVTPVAYGQ